MKSEQASKEMQPEGTDPVSAVVRAGKLGALGLVLAVASVATVIIGTRGANRPHEVSGEGLFYFLLVAHILLSCFLGFTLLSAWLARGRGTLRPIHWLALILALAYLGVVLAFFGRIAWSWVT